MLRCYERTYYSLEDISDDLSLTGKGPYRMTAGRGVTLNGYINSCLEKADYTTYVDTELSNNQYLTTLFQQYIYPMFHDRYVCFTDKDSKPAETFADFVGPVISWMTSGTEKYSLLISNLTENKTKLLGQIKASSVSSFNDTPQNQGDYTDTDHNSTVTKQESSADGGTLLSRLNEIEDRLKQLYMNWAKEFRQFVFWSVC